MTTTSAAAEILDKFGVQRPPQDAPDRYYTTCPKCSAMRSTTAHREAKVLGVTIDAKGVKFGCNHCGWTGGAPYNSSKKNGFIVAEYDYADEGGKLLFQVCRKADKNGFPQRRPNGDGSWTWKTTGVRKVLFHLPQLNEGIANDRLVVVVEGEKDVLSLERIGIVATCNPGGASEPGKKPKWAKEYSEMLRGAYIVVMPDNDLPGYAHADAVCRMSIGIAKSVRLLKLADHWPECPKSGDISDWLAAGHEREELDALIGAAPEWKLAKATLVATAGNVPEWRDFKKDGTPCASLANAVLAVRALGINCRLNLFRHCITVEYNGELADINYFLGEMTDDTIEAIRSLINNTYGVDVGAHALAGVKEIARGNAFDPVRDYLAEVEGKWDGIKRLDDWLTTYCKAEDTPYVRAVGRRHLVASVRRMRQPGVKYDYILVMESPEGMNKSTSVEVLAGADAFSDQTILGLEDRTAQEQLAGVWLYEIADLTGMTKADVDKVKAFASRTVDRARPAYGRILERRPRRCTFWGTTNDDRYLKSQTGNRRFLPVGVGRIDVDALRRDRDQIWAEAAVAKSAGEPIALDKSLWADAAREQEARRVLDPWEEILAEIPEYAIHGGDNENEERVVSSELLTQVLGLPVATQNEGHWRRLSTIVKRNGWERTKTSFWLGGKKVRGYWRIKKPKQP